MNNVNCVTLRALLLNHASTIGFSVNGYGYIALPNSYTGNLYQYSPANDEWKPMAAQTDNYFAPQNSFILFGDNNKLYIYDSAEVYPMLLEADASVLQ
ncbi:MAG TPA: hypothetical protein VK541_01050 [Pedobacter sp.]|uniref:hypothetical protein n=1 Tax=Pedobacter sp. TaxID=1411316 RepID=UPI002CB82BCA|nr:hypothetical protein [Pedobacter sp.]HMI01033.1 hypothetical protein [Pedobacter sp.]